MNYRLPTNHVSDLTLSFIKWCLLLLIAHFFTVNAVAQTAEQIEQQIESEVNSLLAEIESKQAPSSPAVAETLSVFHRSSKLPIAHVPTSSQYSVIIKQPGWLLVRFDQPAVHGWVSQDYVSVSDGVVKVTASALNLRSQASVSSVIIDRLPRGYSSKKLDQRDGFLKVFAPKEIIVAIKQAQAPTVSLKRDDVKIEPSRSIDNQETESIRVGSDSGVKAGIQSSQIKSVGDRSHVIASGDAISLVVYGESDLSIENVRVPQGGQVSLPLIGSVSVAGKTTAEVEKKVYELLSQGYVRDPRLSVTIFSYRPIFIRGAIHQTGAFPFNEGLTIAKAITLAGGAKNSANKQGVSILRDGRVILNSLAIDSQVEIASGDVISVTEEYGVSDDEATYVYLHGEVMSPGEYLYRRGLTVEKAVVLAGGFTLRASRKKMAITRHINKGQGEKPKKLKKVRLYTPVKPGDIIDVGASWF